MGEEAWSEDEWNERFGELRSLLHHDDAVRHAVRVNRLVSSARMQDRARVEEQWAPYLEGHPVHESLAIHTEVLHSFREKIEQLQTTKIRLSLLMSIARFHAMLGFHDEAVELADEVVEATKREIEEPSSSYNPILLRRIQAMMYPAGNPYDLEQWHAWVALNRRFIAADTGDPGRDEWDVWYEELLGRLASFERDQVQRFASKVSRAESGDGQIGANGAKTDREHVDASMIRASLDALLAEERNALVSARENPGDAFDVPYNAFEIIKTYEQVMASYLHGIVDA